MACLLSVDILISQYDRSTVLKKNAPTLSILKFQKIFFKFNSSLTFSKFSNIFQIYFKLKPSIVYTKCLNSLFHLTFSLLNIKFHRISTLIISLSIKDRTLLYACTQMYSHFNFMYISILIFIPSSSNLSTP